MSGEAEESGGEDYVEGGVTVIGMVRCVATAGERMIRGGWPR